MTEGPRENTKQLVRALDGLYERVPEQLRALVSSIVELEVELEKRSNI